MISLSHWSLRYGVDRARAKFYEWTHPDAPWLTRQATAFLERELRPEYVGLEWGSGRSTAWLAKRVRNVISIEHDPAWFARVQSMLRKRNIENVALHFLDARAPEYLAPIQEEADDSLNFVLVDGVSELRDVCALAAVAKVRPGGLLIVDDIHRYLPSHSIAPLALAADVKPLSHAWEGFRARVADWPVTWTSDGVRDTAIWRRQDAARP